MTTSSSAAPLSSPSQEHAAQQQSTESLRVSDDDRVAFKCEWSRFQRVYKQRRLHFLGESQQQTKSTSRLFIISHNEDPWNCFGLTTRMDYSRRVWEVSALHFPELHDACAEGDRKRAHVILQSKGSQDGCTLSRDSSGRIPLHQAVVREHHRVIRLLLRQHDSRLQLHARDNRNATPVQYVLEKIHRLALKMGDKSARQAKELRESSRRYGKLWRLADRMLAGMNASFVMELQSLDLKSRGDAWDAVRTGDVERLKQIRTLYGDFRDLLLDELGTTLLHEACSGATRHLEVVLYLVSEVHAERRAVEQSGATPLHYAAMRGWLEACVLLLDDEQLDGVVDELLMMTDARGRTPLHAALRFMGRSRQADGDPGGDTMAESVATARFLVQRCADALHVVDADGFTPLHYAINAGDHTLVQLMVDLGAAVFRDDPLPPASRSSNSFGPKAAWAPCGRVFFHGRSRRRRPESSDHPVTDGAHEVASLAHEASIVRAEGSSKACERLRKVKAGLVEHPGVTLPMETLWFWVRNKSQKLVESQPGVHTKDVRDSETLDPVQTSDLQRYGCRRFGALCSACAHIPGEQERDTSPPQPSGVTLSPLELAIRCCRQARTPEPNRLAIVETLIQAGAPPDKAALEETIRTPQSLEALQLVLAHSTSGVTLELIIRQFCSRFDLPCGVKSDCEPSLLLLLDELSPDDLTKAVAPLFYRRFFSVVEEVLAHPSREATTVEAIVHEIIRRTPASHGSKANRQLTTDHLDCVVRWITLWPSHTQALTSVAITSISAVLSSSTPLTAKARRAADTELSTALELLSIHAKDTLHESATEWTVRALKRGFATTVQCLWGVIVSSHSLATAFVNSVTWPLRSADAGLRIIISGCIPSLVQAIVEGTDSTTVDAHRSVLAQCLAMACSYEVPEKAMRRLIACINQTKCDDQAVDVLLSQRANGVTLIHHIVKQEGADLVEMLWTELKLSDATRERLWIALVKARLCSPHIQTANTERWNRLLLLSFPDIVDSDALTKFVLQVLVRATQPCSNTAQTLLRWVGGPQGVVNPTTAVEWAANSLFFHVCARYNAFPVVRLSCETWGTADTKSAISRLVTQRDVADGYSAIELCELLGHHELARYYRELTLDTQSTTPEATWIPENHRRFGLFRTAMSLPSLPTETSSAAATKIDRHASVWEGDWQTAVAVNDVRVLQAFSLHDLPLHTQCPDASSEASTAAVTSLMETAIRHGSEAAVEWLLARFSSELLSLSPETSARLLHRAASHTSVLFARLTLRLLRQPGFVPGRIGGDGTDVSLLHRVACFDDSELAVQAFEWLFQLDGCDANVRDGFGSTPVMYAIACGRLETACWLLNHCQHTRLEAEYEGQSLFYYSLHLLPSFAWRSVVQALLTAKRKAAYLHCEADDCACKGFEESTSSGDQEDDRSCSFCSHVMETHTRVPYPPWFRDQYETYVRQKSHGEASGNDDEDEDDERRRCALMATPLADEPTLERDRGRLRIPALLRLTQLRFHALLSLYELSIPPVEDAAVTAAHEPDEEEATVFADSGANLADTDTASSRQLPPVPTTLLSSCPPAAVEEVLPRFLHGDAAMVLAHGPCCRLNLHDAQSPAAQTQIVLAKWFRLSNQRQIFVLSDRVSTLRGALARWLGCDVTTALDPAASTSTSWVGTRDEHNCPVAQEPTAENNPEERSTTSMNLSDRTVDVIGPLRGTTSIANANRCVSILQLFVHHWRYARVYQSFRQWKRLMVNAQVAHHELETLVDTWSACDRREKLQGLKAKQHALEMEIRKQGL